MSDLEEFEAETVTVNITISNSRAIDSKTIFALVDVEINIAGVVLEIRGVQARREPDGRTSVRLPTYKDAAGLWQAAIRLPPETHASLTDAVLAFLLEKGLARRKF